MINFGILGVMPLGYFLFYRLKEMVGLFDDRRGLLIAMSVVVVVHGLLDATIFWSQTSFIYLSLLMMSQKFES